jgi:hypothetical protein
MNRVKAKDGEAKEEGGKKLSECVYKEQEVFEMELKNETAPRCILSCIFYVKVI